MTAERYADQLSRLGDDHIHRLQHQFPQLPNPRRRRSEVGGNLKGGKSQPKLASMVVRLPQGELLPSKDVGGAAPGASNSHGRNENEEEGREKAEKERGSRPRVLPPPGDSFGELLEKEAKARAEVAELEARAKKAKMEREEEEQKLKSAKEARLRDLETQADDLRQMLGNASWPWSRGKDGKNGEAVAPRAGKAVAMPAVPMEDDGVSLADSEMEVVPAGGSVARSDEMTKTGGRSAPAKGGSHSWEGFLVFGVDDGKPRELSREEGDYFGGGALDHPVAFPRREKRGKRNKWSNGSTSRRN